MSELTNDEKLDDMERVLHEQLAEIRQAYEKAAEPYIKRLLHIHNIRQPKILISRDQLQQLGIDSMPRSPRLVYESWLRMTGQ